MLPTRCGRVFLDRALSSAKGVLGLKGDFPPTVSSSGRL